MISFKEVVRTNRAWLCLDCGKCSSVCPITIHLVDRYTSPRLLVERALSAGEGSVLEDPLLWSCLTCGRCSEICPSRVEFTSFIQGARQLARQLDLSGDCTHSGMIQAWGRMMANPDRVQNRLDWISTDLRLSQDSDTIYWPGCLPYYQEAFGNLGIEGIQIALAAVKILNHLGIEPILLDQECCCGHDQFWQGDMTTFRKLAENNLETIRKSGAKRIVTTCPECAYTLKNTYPDEVGEHNLEILNLVELLDQTGFSVSARNGHKLPGRSATYQDPCRLGRLAGIYQQPRDLIRQVGYDLVEMDQSRESSICCGTSCWSTCGQTNKKIQAERLREASSTGADTLITTCIKCQIHLKCAQTGSSADKDRMEIRDLATILAEAI
jgi:heterodisulfide reductase subunit D